MRGFTKQVVLCPSSTRTRTAGEEVEAERALEVRRRPALVGERHERDVRRGHRTERDARGDAVRDRSRAACRPRRSRDPCVAATSLRLVPRAIAELARRRAEIDVDATLGHRRSSRSRGVATGWVSALRVAASDRSSLIGGVVHAAVARAKRLLRSERDDAAVAIEAEHERVGDDVAPEHAVDRAAVAVVARDRRTTIAGRAARPSACRAPARGPRRRTAWRCVSVSSSSVRRLRPCCRPASSTTCFVDARDRSRRDRSRTGTGPCR